MIAMPNTASDTPRASPIAPADAADTDTDTRHGAAGAQREFMFSVGQVHKQWRRTVDRLLSPLGLSQALWLPLLHLAHADAAMRQKDLAQSLGLDSSSVVRLVDGLVAKGWVARADDSDRRVKKVQLTVAGRAQVAHVEALINQTRERLMGTVAPEALATAHAVLRQFLSAMPHMQAAASPLPDAPSGTNAIVAPAAQAPTRTARAKPPPAR